MVEKVISGARTGYDAGWPCTRYGDIVGARERRARTGRYSAPRIRTVFVIAVGADKLPRSRRMQCPMA